MPETAALRALAVIYAKVPKLICRGLYSESCGPIAASQLSLTLVYAPKTCRRCSDCEGTHHFSVHVGTSDEEPDHPAAKVGCPCWYTCKHCSAWTLDPEDGTPIFSGPEEGH